MKEWDCNQCRRNNDPFRLKFDASYAVPFRSAIIETNRQKIMTGPSKRSNPGNRAVDAQIVSSQIVSSQIDRSQNAGAQICNVAILG